MKKNKTPKTNPARSRTMMIVRISLDVVIVLVTVAYRWDFVPYKVGATLSVLLFPAVLVFMACFRDVLTFGEDRKRRSGKADVTLMMFFSFAAMMLASGDFYVPEKVHLLLWELGIGIITFIISAVFLRKIMMQGTQVLWMVIICLLFGFFAAGQVNVALGNSTPTEIRAVVEDKYHRSSARYSDIYQITMVTVDGDEIVMDVGSKQYGAVEVGEAVTIYTYEGGLGVPYMRLEQDD